MKSHYLITVMLIATILIGCHKDVINKEPKVTEQSVVLTSTTAAFTWTVDWPGKLASVVEISENEDMSNSQIFGSETETEDHNFMVTATGLKESTKYYYRYWVWNKNYVNGKFKLEVKSFMTLPEGAITGLFTINSNKEQVLFSQGNLQYQASTNTWQFAEHQYDVIGDNNSNISSSYSGWIDLFGWGTSGYNNKYPYMTSTIPTDYGNGDNDIVGTHYDWGVHNEISNGGNQTGLWRTLTKDEWVYVFNTRNTASGIRYVKACVNGMNGVILLPDDWSVGYYSLSSTNNDGASFSSNIISASQWIILEQHGAVFLPAAGGRNVTSVGGVGFYGYYWSTSCYYNSSNAYYVYFDDSNLGLQGYNRRNGFSVRLVCSAK